jgi:nitrate reductase gamma subunit
VTTPALLLVAALVVAVGSLVRARLAIGSVRAPSFAHPRGSAAAGVRYAFTTAFMPWAKESASGHLATYLAGIAYHAGIFAMLARLILTPIPVAVPRSIERALAVVFAVALACGVGLLVKRRLDARLRAISVPDDLISNLLVDAAIAAALAAVLVPGAVPLFQLLGAALLVYAPLSKLRHMLFLLTSRRLTGEYYGRRGVRP